MDSTPPSPLPFQRVMQVPVLHARSLHAHPPHPQLTQDDPAVYTWVACIMRWHVIAHADAVMISLMIYIGLHISESYYTLKNRIQHIHEVILIIGYAIKYSLLSK